MNSRPTLEFHSKNIVMADEWNCQKRYVSVDPQIISENRVTVDLEIVNEY
jgi:hypothetical protein